MKSDEIYLTRRMVTECRWQWMKKKKQKRETHTHRHLSLTISIAYCSVSFILIRIQMTDSFDMNSMWYQCKCETHFLYNSWFVRINTMDDYMHTHIWKQHTHTHTPISSWVSVGARHNINIRAKVRHKNISFIHSFSTVKLSHTLVVSRYPPPSFGRLQYRCRFTE